MLSSDILNPLLNNAFTRKITWLDASSQHTLDEFIETFYNMRKRTQESVDGMTDAQVAFASLAHSIWSVSESVTHLIYTQGFYINKLLAVSTSAIPHIVEAARGFGEGAKIGISAEELRKRLVFATEQVETAIEGTRHNHDLEKRSEERRVGKDYSD